MPLAEKKIKAMFRGIWLVYEECMKEVRAVRDLMWNEDLGREFYLSTIYLKLEGSTSLHAMRISLHGVIQFLVSYQERHTKMSPGLLCET